VQALEPSLKVEYFKYWTNLELTVSDKRPSLVRRGINYDRTKLYGRGSSKESSCSTSTTKTTTTAPASTTSQASLFFVLLMAPRHSTLTMTFNITTLSITHKL
jgi:hypothetical protein